MDINKLLEQFNLSPSEAAAYLKLLEEGDINVSLLGKATGVTRMAGYNAAEELVRRGFASYSDIGGKKRLVAESPEKLLALQSEKEQSLALDRKRLEEALPELNELFLYRACKPQIKVYQGHGGMKSMFDDVIRDLKNGGHYDGYATKREELKELHPYFEDFKEKCRKHKITFRMIVPVEKERYERGVKPEHEEQFAYIANWQYPFSNEIFLYKNKISIMSFKDQIGVILESKEIYETQKMIFDLAWKGAKIS